MSRPPIEFSRGAIALVLENEQTVDDVTEKIFTELEEMGANPANIMLHTYWFAENYEGPFLVVTPSDDGDSLMVFEGENDQSMVLDEGPFSGYTVSIPAPKDDPDVQ